MIAKVTKLKRAVFKNDPAKSIYGAADSNRSFPDDCVVYYPQGSHTWAAELKDDGTWQATRPASGTVTTSPSSPTRSSPPPARSRAIRTTSAR